MKKEIILKGKDFILRPFKDGDEIYLTKIINNKDLQKDLRNRPYKKFNIKDFKDLSSDKNLFIIDIGGVAVGIINIAINKEETFKASLGYWISKEYWGKGIMTQAIKLVTYYSFNKLKLRRIFAETHSKNKASQKVLVKNGYKLEGILRNNTIRHGKIADDYLFAKVK